MDSIDNKLLNNLLIFDAHCDSANILIENQNNFKKNNSHLDLEKINYGGLKAQIFALWVNPIFSKDKPSDKALNLLDVLEKKVFSLGYGTKINSIKDMDLSIKKKTLACWIFIEGGHIIENSIKKLDFFHSIGIKGITITHNKNTDWADSSEDSPKWDGLNKLGIKILKRIEELKIIVDVSHSSDNTINDVIDISSKPIMASHSNSRSLCNIERNLPDNIISEIGENGGFIGVNFFPGFLNKNIYDQIINNLNKYKKGYEKKIQENKEKPDFIREIDGDFSKKLIQNNDYLDLNAVIDHVIQIADIGGINCVGLGSDFDGIPSTPIDLKDVSFYPNLIEGLIDGGFNFKEIKKIMGLNLYNFLKKFE
ncbi:MAG: membrane dipeptidase [Candidatus Thermoplasmatota archaeon]